MSARTPLPPRRETETITFDHAMSRGGKTQSYIVSYSRTPQGHIGEVFINTNQKAGSESDVNANDAAVAVSIALQYGVPLEVIADAMRRNPDGSPMSALAHALDILRKAPP